jgi:aspartate aminotransferase-like enzyme
VVSGETGLEDVVVSQSPQVVVLEVSGETGFEEVVDDVQSAQVVVVLLVGSTFSSPWSMLAKLPKNAVGCGGKYQQSMLGINTD